MPFRILEPLANSAHNPLSASSWHPALFSALGLTLTATPFLQQILAHTNIVSAGCIGITLILAWTLLLIPVICLLPRQGWRWVVAILGLIGAVSCAFSELYGVTMSPSMLRNALSTDLREISELVSWRLFSLSLLIWAPSFLTSLLAPSPQRQMNRKTLRTSLGAVAGLTALIVSIVAFNATSLIGALRADRSIRYQLMPLSPIYSLTKTLITDTTPKSFAREEIDPSPMLEPAGTSRPLLTVVVIGETARAANWGLSGYQRNTTPELQARSVINFRDVTACGTSTDVSLPCMFSRIGRTNYNRKNILREESVLSVIQRAGVNVTWVDNQSGCKGVCTKDMLETVDGCSTGRCMDMNMVGNVRRAIEKASNDSRHLLILHMMGSHGPAYWRRSNSETFGKGCRNDSFSACSRDQIIDSYDNSIVYTDKVLSAVIDELRATTEMDTAMLYVSDHGESLGEKGLWLHGAPYAISPAEQRKVPMVLWASDSFLMRYGLNRKEIERLANRPVTHDALYDTLLTLSGVRNSSSHFPGILGKTRSVSDKTTITATRVARNSAS